MPRARGSRRKRRSGPTFDEPAAFARFAEGAVSLQAPERRLEVFRALVALAEDEDGLRMPEADRQRLEAEFSKGRTIFR